MSEPKPALSVVRSGDDPSGDGGERGERKLGRSFWLVALLLVLAAVALLFQNQQVRELEGAVARLESDLGAARAARVAYEAQLSQVRGQMGGVREALSGLEAQLSRLDALVEQDPAEGP